MNISPTNKNLFGEDEVFVPKTEGIKYAGSKLKLIPHILNTIASIPIKTVFDGFSGTTRVSQALAKLDYQVISSDISVWSEIFGTCYLKGGSQSLYVALIEHLNNCQPIEGWFSEHYSNADESNPTKQPWQRHNMMRLDAIREEIDNLNLTKIEKSVALTALILALDKVDNTLGHFCSYLKQYSPRSYKYLNLKPPLIRPYEEKHAVHRGDIFDLVKEVQSDLAYFDPPYGSNNEKMPPSRVRYAAYYHIWKTIILNDKPELFGVARRRLDTKDTVAPSIFEEFRKDEQNKFIAVKAIEKLLAKVNARFILLSYSSGGRATAEDMNVAIHNVGKLLSVQKINHTKNVMSNMRWTDDWIRDKEQKNVEYLFLIEKS